MKLPTIQSLWIGSPLSKLEQLTIQSFIAHGHEFHLYVYDDVQGVPDAAVVKDGNEILPAAEVFRDDHNSVASFSDWFRFALLTHKGGYWVDMDIVCLKPFDFDAARGLIFGMEKENLAGVSVLGGFHSVLVHMREACEDFPKFMPFDSLKTKLRKIRRKITFKGRGGARYGSVAGPLPFTDALRYVNILGEGKPPQVFYPIPSPHWRDIFTAESNAESMLTADTHAVQWWNSRAVASGVDKNATFPQASLIEKLKLEHGI